MEFQWPFGWLRHWSTPTGFLKTDRLLENSNDRNGVAEKGPGAKILLRVYIKIIAVSRPLARLLAIGHFHSLLRCSNLQHLAFPRNSQCMDVRPVKEQSKRRCGSRDVLRSFGDLTRLNPCSHGSEGVLRKSQPTSMLSTQKVPNLTPRAKRGPAR